jgi:hypothetical protein
MQATCDSGILATMAAERVKSFWKRDYIFPVQKLPHKEIP